MSRNPMAGSLRHYRQQIVRDRRENMLAKELDKAVRAAGYPLNMIGLPDPDGTSQV